MTDLNPQAMPIDSLDTWITLLTTIIPRGEQLLRATFDQEDTDEKRLSLLRLVLTVAKLARGDSQLGHFVVVDLPVLEGWTVDEVAASVLDRLPSPLWFMPFGEQPGDAQLLLASEETGKIVEGIIQLGMLIAELEGAETFVVQLPDRMHVKVVAV